MTLVVIANAVLASVLACSVYARSGVIARKIEYWRHGWITADGIKIALPPDDPFLGYLIAHGSRETESTLASVIRRELKEGDTFIDIGANIGWFAILAAKQVGPTGRVIAFEPEPRNFKLLQKNVELNGLRNVVCEQKALSSEAGKLRLYLSTTNENHSVSDLGDGRGFIEVDSVRLDDYLKGYDGRVRGIKIDTEGAEGLIVAGARETLSKLGDGLVVMEFDPYLLKSAGTEPKALLGDLGGLGFAASRIDESRKQIEPVAPDQVDGLATGRGCNLLLRRPRLLGGLPYSLSGN